MSHPQIDGDTAPAPSATKTPCNCWEDTNAKLREMHGVELSDALTFLSSRSLSLVRVLPLQRVDGAKMKRREPATLQMGHCPFCGVEY